MTDKLCECGCGNPSGFYKNDNSVYGQTAGAPRRFIPHHHQRGYRHHKWNGGESVTGDGYKEVRMPGHHRVSSRGYVKEHIAIAEQALGHPLPDDAVVHHGDGTRSNNGCLVICENQSFHLLLHQRMRAYAATGKVSSVKCSHCQKWGMTGEGEMRTKKSGRSYHLSCNATYEDSRRRKESESCQS